MAEKTIAEKVAEVFDETSKEKIFQDSEAEWERALNEMRETFKEMNPDMSDEEIEEMVQEIIAPTEEGRGI